MEYYYIKKTYHRYERAYHFFEISLEVFIKNVEPGKEYTATYERAALRHSKKNLSARKSA